MAVSLTLCVRCSILAIGCALAALPVSRLEAQVVQLRPVADFSVPTRFSIDDGSIHVRQKVGLTLGARMILSFSERFDVVTAVTYSPGYATLHGAGKRIELATGGQSLGTSAGARYWVWQPTERLSWELNSGLGVVFGGQPGYGDPFETSTISGSIGSTWVYRIGTILSLKLKVRERLFKLRFGDFSPGSSKSPLQVSFGVGLPFLEGFK